MLTVGRAQARKIRSCIDTVVGSLLIKLYYLKQYPCNTTGITRCNICNHIFAIFSLALTSVTQDWRQYSLHSLLFLLWFWLVWYFICFLLCRKDQHPQQNQPSAVWWFHDVKEEKKPGLCFSSLTCMCLLQGKVHKAHRDLEWEFKVWCLNYSFMKMPTEIIPTCWMSGMFQWDDCNYREIPASYRITIQRSCKLGLCACDFFNESLTGDFSLVYLGS